MQRDAPARDKQPVSFSLANLLLTSDYKQRRCLQTLGLSSLVYGICIAILAYGSARGLFAPGPVRYLALAMACTVVTFYVIVRSGFNQRFDEPTLTFPQAVVGQALIAGSYALSESVHAGTLILLPLVMIFGMFDMQVWHARVLAAYSIILIGATMLFCSYTNPAVYIPEREFMYFALTVTVLFSISKLSEVLTHMRRRLKSQKAELETALTHINEMATHDDLTRLSNRRHILDLLDQHAVRHARGGPSFYVVMADLDLFKSINDTYGHAVGDEALRTFSRTAQAQLRNTDVIGRWGGEEFLLIMPETPPGDPNVGIERLRTALETARVNDAVPDLRIRFSAGLSRYRDGEAVGDTIERADRAVYAAKAAGRNCTVAL